MKPSNQQQINIEKTKQKRNRSRSEPKSYRNLFGYRASLPGAFFGSIKNTSQARKTSIQARRQSSDGDSSIKNDASSSRSRQIKSTKQNKSALRKAETQKFSSLISSLNELLSKTLIPIDLHQQLTQRLNEINQNGLDMIKNDSQDENSDLFVESWNNFISNFQNFLSESTKNQLITFFSSHIDSMQNVMNNVADFPPTNLNFVPTWSSLLLQFNSDLKNMKEYISNFKKQNNNEIKNNMTEFSNLLKSFQVKLNDTRLFKLSSFSMSKRDESHFTVSKLTIRMIKYSDEFSKDQFSNGLENSLVLATEKINSLIPQFLQIFSSQNNENKLQKSLKKLNKNTKSSSNNRNRTNAKNNQNGSVKSGNKTTRISNVKNPTKTINNEENQNKNVKKNTAEIDNDSNDTKNIDDNTDNENNENDSVQDANDSIEEEEYNDENISEHNNDSNEIEDEDNNENLNEDDNGEDDPSVNFQLKTAKKYNKIFKKKLDETLQEEKNLNDEINEKTAALDSSRKLLRNLKLTRNQIDAVQRRTDALKTKAALEKQLDSLRSEVSRHEEKLRSKKEEHDQLLSVKKDLEDAQMENEYIKNVKKINLKYLRRLNSTPTAKNSPNSSSNPIVCVSETASSLLAPASIATTTQTNQSSSTFDQTVIDAVKKLQEELETVKAEYDKLIKERTTNNDNSENNEDPSNLTLLRIYYDAQRFQQENQTLKNELQAAQLRSISIAKETEIDSYFKSIMQTKKRELKELEKISSNLKTGPNATSKSSSSSLSSTASQTQRRNSQPSAISSSFYDRTSLLGRDDFDPMDATLNERSRLQQEYYRLQPGPQEETKKRRVSIKKQLAKMPQLADEYVQLDETSESLMFSRSKLKSAIESNAAAIDALNNAILMKEETEIAEMIARRRLEQLHIEFPIDLLTEKKSKKKYDEEEEMKRIELKRKQEEEEEEEKIEEEEEEKEEEDKTDDESKEIENKKEEKPKQNTNISNSNSGFKINFNFSSFGSKTNTNKKEISPSNSKLAVMSSDDKKEGIEKELDKKDEEEEEEEESNIGDEFIPNLIRLRQVNNERAEMEEKLRAIEEMFTTLFGDRIPPNVTLNLNDKIELVMRQFNKTE